MSFRPSVHGWPFATPSGPDAAALGLGAEPESSPGLGGGLCWAALDRYLRGVSIPRDVAAPGPGEPLHAELIRRTAAAQTDAWARVRRWQARPDGSWRDRLPVRVGGGGDVAALTRAEWPWIRRRLDRGEPVLLTLLDSTDPYRRSRAAWQVLATAWSQDGTRAILEIYDPARPGDDDVRLGFGLAGALEARLTGDRAVRGFFPVEYDRDPPDPLHAETFADRSVVGLNRKIHGRPSPAARRRRLDLVARDADGSLLHYCRRSGQSWEGENVTDRERLRRHELHSDPIAAGIGATLHVFALDYVGDLLHFTLRRGWRMSNRTEHKRAGARFRLSAGPVVAPGPRRRLSVLGLDSEGGLVHYAGHPLRGWRAEQVPGEPLAGAPAAAWIGSTLHVAGLTREGRVIHWTREHDRWTAADTDARLKGGLLLRVSEGVLHLAGRTPEGALSILTREPDGRWNRRSLPSIAGDPTATTGPAGLHVFARTEEGGLLHAWTGGGWEWEDIPATRPALPRLPLEGTLSAWGTHDEIRVWARAADELFVIDWKADADWSMIPLGCFPGVSDRHRMADAPAVLTDAAGRPHLFGTDGRGTVLHLEPGEWHEPEPRPGSAARPAIPASSSTRLPPVPAAPDDKTPTPRTGQTPPVRPDSGPRHPASAEPGRRASDSAAATPSQGTPPWPDEPPGDRAQPWPDEPAASTPPWPDEPLSDRAQPWPDEPAASTPPWPEEPPGDGAQPRSDDAPETAPPVPDIEPMDLSLLDTWPAAPGQRRPRAEENATGSDEQREAS